MIWLQILWGNWLVNYEFLKENFIFPSSQGQSWYRKFSYLLLSECEGLLDIGSCIVLIILWDILLEFYLGGALGFISCLPYILCRHERRTLWSPGLDRHPVRVKDNLGIYFPLSTVPGFTSFGGLAYSLLSQQLSNILKSNF